MAQSHLLLRIFNALIPFFDFLYILQLEEYDSRRYVKWLNRFFFKRNIQVRDSLKFTSRAKIILGVAFMLWMGAYILLFVLSPLLIVRVGMLLPWLLSVPLFVLLSNILTSPYFNKAKLHVQKRAQEKIESLSNMKIIVVAGSYGKTTVKNYIYQLIKYTHQSQMVPGNINTAVGIAHWILKKLNVVPEVLIVEVDTYGLNEITQICQMVSPSIAVLTNIGDQHLERFKNEDTLKHALAEVFTSAAPDAQCITTDKTAFQLVGIDLDERTLHTVGSDSSSPFSTNTALSVKVAELLDVPTSYIKDSIKKLEMPDRRQKLGEMYGYEAIDDSYNISFTTAQAGINEAVSQASQREKKLLVLTAGIPELSKANKDKNFELGRTLRDTADFVIILDSIFSADIASGIGDDSRYEIVASLSDFVQHDKKWDKTEWFLLVQPELNDLYY